MAIEIVWSYFSGFDVFRFGLISAINLFIFLYIFVYAGRRGREKNPSETAASVSIYTILVAFIMAMLDVPALMSAAIIIIAFTLIHKHFTKLVSRDWLENFIAMWLLLLIWAFVGEYLRTLFSIVALIFFFFLSERKVREEKKKEEGKAEKKDAKK